MAVEYHTARNALLMARLSCASRATQGKVKIEYLKDYVVERHVAIREVRHLYRQQVI